GRIQRGAGGGGAGRLNRVAAVTPHGHHTAVGQGGSGPGSGQVDLLAECHAAGQQQNSGCESRVLQDRLVVVGAHLECPLLSSIRRSRIHANRPASSSTCRPERCCWW